MRAVDWAYNDSIAGSHLADSLRWCGAVAWRRSPASPVAPEILKSAARLEFGTLDCIIGCVAADMGITLLPRAVAERSELSGAIRTHALRSEQRRVDTLFIHRRTLHEGCALRSFLSCLKNGRLSLAA